MRIFSDVQGQLTPQLVVQSDRNSTHLPRPKRPTPKSGRNDPNSFGGGLAGGLCVKAVTEPDSAESTEITERDLRKMADNYDVPIPGFRSVYRFDLVCEVT